jgi:hypothetical protein
MDFEMDKRSERAEKARISYQRLLTHGSQPYHKQRMFRDTFEALAVNMVQGRYDELEPGLTPEAVTRKVFEAYCYAMRWDIQDFYEEIQEKLQTADVSKEIEELKKDVRLLALLEGQKEKGFNNLQGMHSWLKEQSANVARLSDNIWASRQGFLPFSPEDLAFLQKTGCVNEARFLFAHQVMGMLTPAEGVEACEIKIPALLRKAEAPFECLNDVAGYQWHTEDYARELQAMGMLCRVKDAQSSLRGAMNGDLAAKRTVFLRMNELRTKFDRRNKWRFRALFLLSGSEAVLRHLPIAPKRVTRLLAHEERKQKEALKIALPELAQN